jgi:TolB-like protein/DNA-binding winged helix-turn-helix (wHTH) protein
MGNSQLNGSLARFGVFELDSRAGELRKQGVRIRLQDQPLQVLQILLEQPGEIVSREELQRRVWPPDTFVDFDHGLHNAIKKLREALGDSAETPRYIETIPKRGYRFIAPIHGNGANGNRVAIGSVPRLLSTKDTSRWRQALAWGFIAGSFTVILLAVSSRTVFDKLRQLFALESHPSIHSVAVLPLQNLSGDPTQEYFSDGVTEELITMLSRISALKVVSRTSVMRYKKTDRSLPEIARDLNVDAIVEGSVFRSGGQVRITVQLIYAPTDVNLWAQTYDGDLRDVLTLQGNLAGAIAEEIKVKLTPSERAFVHASRQVNLAAHEAYLQGRFHLEQAGQDWYKRNKETFGHAEAVRALTYFQQAAKEDPNYAPAYLGMSEAYSSFQPPDPPEKWAPLAKAAVLKAVQLDDSVAKVHSALAGIRGCDRDWAGAEKELKRALELDPNNAEFHGAYGTYLGNIGRPDEAMREFQRAQELDPKSERLADGFYYKRQFDRAIELYQSKAQANPTDSLLHFRMGFIYRFMGRPEESVHEYQRMMEILDYGDYSRALARGVATGGYEGALREWAKRLEPLANRIYIPGWSMAQVYAQLGDKDRAFAWMERSYAALDGLDDLKGEPAWDPLRSDPRFDAFVRRMGL